MLKVFLSYARADGSAAAVRLRGELTALGFQVWRDIEDMAGGLDWRGQLRAALRQVDVVIALLTPGAVASQTVRWEWDTALTLEKRLIGALIAACDVPDELKRLHYHDLSEPTTYSLGLAKLGRDLMRMALELTAAEVGAGRKEASDASTYRVETAINSAVGNNPVVVNQGAAVSGVEALRIVAALRAAGAPSDVGARQEWQAVLQEIQAGVRQANVKLDALNEGQAQLLARYEVGEQRVITAVVARLDSQQVALSQAIVDGLEAGKGEREALVGHLAAIEAALAEVRQRAGEIQDRQLVASAHQVAELIEAPGLDVKHKLKLTAPLIPWLLDYEGEVELGQRLNLETAWNGLKRLAGWTQVDGGK